MTSYTIPECLTGNKLCLVFISAGHTYDLCHLLICKNFSPVTFLRLPLQKGMEAYICKNNVLGQ